MSSVLMWFSISDTNVVSLILATLLVASWGFACLGRGGFWISIGLSLILGTGLVIYHPTNGSVVGAVAGLAWIAFWLYPEATRNRIVVSGSQFVALDLLAWLMPKNAS